MALESFGKPVTIQKMIKLLAESFHKDSWTIFHLRLQSRLVASDSRYKGGGGRSSDILITNKLAWQRPLHYIFLKKLSDLKNDGLLTVQNSHKPSSPINSAVGIQTAPCMSRKCFCSHNMTFLIFKDLSLFT